MKTSESNRFSILVKTERKRLGLTQADLALRAGVGLRFVRDLEQGKPSLRLDTLNQLLYMFGYEAGPVRIESTSSTAQSVQIDQEEPDA
ncbi:helix-turn-helix transcriptional regulator [Spirochaeta dissipatitropha]